MPAARSVVRDYARRMPFTLIAAATVLVVAAVSNTLSHAIHPALLDRVGFGLEDLRTGTLIPLLTAPFFLLRPFMALTIPAGILLFVGAAEYLLGTRRTLIVFWASHVVGYVGALLVLLPLRGAGLDWAAGLLANRDVGASNAMFGCGAAAAVALPPRARRNVLLALGTWLVLMLIAESRLWDLQHLIAFGFGTVLGAVLVGRHRHVADLEPRFEFTRRRRPELVAWLVGVTGFVSVIAPFVVVQEPAIDRLEESLPFILVHAPRHLLLAGGFVLLFLAPGLARGQRAAWMGSLIALAASTAGAAGTRVHPLALVPSVAFFVLLVLWRDSFRAPSDPASIRRGLRLLAISVFGVFVYGAVGFYVLRVHFHGADGLWTAVRETATRAVFLDPAGVHPHSRRAAWFLSSLPLLAWGGVLASIGTVLRGATGPRRHPDDLVVARRIFREHGAGGTSFMALWEGNSLFFDPARSAFLAYQVRARTAVVLGDPMGPARLLPGLVRDFAAHAAEQGWNHVFYAATEALLPLYRELGYEALRIGEEAVIPLAELEFKGKKWQTMRTALNRAEREGITFRMVRGGAIPAEVRDELEAVSREWEDQRKLPPMGFTLGTTKDLDDPDVEVAVARDATGRVHAFADWLPVPARHGWVIDLMRHRGDSFTGAMEYVIGMSLLTFKQRGDAMASLATAPLADLDRDEDASFLQKALGQIAVRFDRYYSFQSLFRYKEKFQPRWESSYLIHQGPSTLPRATRALLEAHLPTLDFRAAVQMLGSTFAEQIRGRGEDREAPASGPET